MTPSMWWLDFKLGLRMLVKYPALTIVGGLGMAVAIAVSVGGFAFMGAHLYPKLPLDEGERIVSLENRDVELNNEVRKSLHDFVLWKGELKWVRELGAFRNVMQSVTAGSGAPESVPIAEMTASGFTVARVAPLMGRYLTASDEQAGAPAVLVVGYDAWKQRFAGNPNVVGTQVQVGRTMHTIVGVMPEHFGFPMNHSLWTPFRVDPTKFARREGPGIYIFGRLAPGVTMEQAQAELTVIGQRTAAAFPASNAKLRPMVMPYTHSLTDIQGTTMWMAVQVQLMLNLLLIVVALNVAVLVYARTATRQGEIAVRSALGASRGRIVGQLFIEALVLSLGAAAVGLLLAHVGVGLGNRIMDSEAGTRPFWADYSLRPMTVLFTVGIAVFAAVIVGVVPALQATGKRLQGNLRQMGGGTGIQLGKTWTVLIVAQVAVAVAALPAAVSIGLNEIRGAATRPTVGGADYLVTEMRPESPDENAAAAAPVDPAQFGDRMTEIVRQLAAEPRVLGATYAAELPGHDGRIEIDGMPAPKDSPSGHEVRSVGIATNYLRVYGARLRTGRAFELRDGDSASTAVVVTQGFVRKVLGNTPALGRRVRYAGTPARAGEKEVPPSRWYEIVGVVEDTQVNPLDSDLVPARLFYPLPPSQLRDAALTIRVRGDAPKGFVPTLRGIVLRVDPTMRVGRTYSVADFDSQGQLAVRLVSLVIGLVLVSVFLLSAGGIYALTSFTVTRRRREIGIRAALGALPRQVLRSIFGRLARQIAIGVAVGLVSAVALEQATGGEMMHGRAAVLLPGFAIVMAVVAVLAAVGPARRGLRIQPSEALRADV